MSNFDKTMYKSVCELLNRQSNGLDFSPRSLSQALDIKPGILKLCLKRAIENEVVFIAKTHSGDGRRVELTEQGIEAIRKYTQPENPFERDLGRVA